MADLFGVAVSIWLLGRQLFETKDAFNSSNHEVKDDILREKKSIDYFAINRIC